MAAVVGGHYGASVLRRTALVERRARRYAPLQGWHSSAGAWLCISSGSQIRDLGRHSGTSPYGSSESSSFRGRPGGLCVIPVPQAGVRQVPARLRGGGLRAPSASAVGLRRGGGARPDGDPARNRRHTLHLLVSVRHTPPDRHGHPLARHAHQASLPECHIGQHRFTRLGILAGDGHIRRRLAHIPPHERL